MANWYYVDGSERVGPISEETLKSLYNYQRLNEETYIWRKGFANWERLKNVNEINFENKIEDTFQNLNLVADTSIDLDSGKIRRDTPSKIEIFTWNNLNRDEEKFFVKIGLDRPKSAPKNYGPYSINQILESIKQKRMSEKTLLFCVGMNDWASINSIPFFKEELGLVALALPVRTKDPLYFYSEKKEEKRVLLINELNEKSGWALSNFEIQNGKKMTMSLFMGSKLIKQNIEIEIDTFSHFERLANFSLLNLSEDLDSFIKEFNE
jgi:hypothetical protein